MRKMLIVFLAAIVGMGCVEQRDGVSSVRIVPIITRVTGMNFDRGDCIGLRIARGSEVYTANVQMTYDGGAFSAPGLVWYDNPGEKSTLTAYYPYSDQGVSTQFAVAADQRDGCTPSDLLAAVSRDVTPAAEPVAMVFHHLMSQLSIITTNSSSSKISEVAVEGLVPIADLDLGVPDAEVRSGVPAVDVVAFCVTPDACYRAVLVPQQAALTLRITTDNGKVLRKTIPDAILQGGYCYDLSVAVTNTDIAVTISGEIGDWQDGGSLGGKDPDGEDDGVLVYEGVRYRTISLGGRLWMAENLRCEPVGVGLGYGMWNPVGGSSEVVRQGLLYNYATATVGAKTGEAVQGICPPGWSLPDAACLAALVADPKCNGDFFSCAGFWIVRPSGDIYGLETKGYLMSSTLSDGKCAALSYTTTTVAIQTTISAEYGISVRCVRNLK